MTERWLEEALAGCGLPPPLAFPRDLATEAPVWLPVTLVPLPRLTTDAVRDWLTRYRLRPTLDTPSRRVHGCMVAWVGKGILFHDSEDGEDERRFTVAHEVAHFVLDHLLPRRRALRAFGEGIREVLDGKRPPGPGEALSSALEGVPLGMQVKLLDRDGSGSIRAGRVMQSEWRADRLAFELLAPAALAREELSPTREEAGVARLASRFGLPREVAREYARVLRPARKPRFSILEFLGEDGR
jgi:predicted small lipoprotein YifL